jgi:3'-5' exoribonuclease
MPKIFIENIASGTKGFDEVLSIKEIQKHKAKNGDSYFRLVLQDRTGTVGAKIWKDAFLLTNAENLATSDVIKADFEASEYNGVLQLTLKRAEKVTEYDMDDLMKTTTKNLDELYDKVVAILESTKDAEIRGVMLRFIKDPEITEKFKKSIAAEKVHHDYIGGLMEHYLEMFGLAEALMQFYPRANRSIVIAGILFHDIGKLYELGIDQTNFVRTLPGYLIGHITIGIQMFEKILPPDFNEEKKIAIQHIILSHHKEVEYGAVVRPSTLEAIIVAMVDFASSHTRQFQKELDEGKPDETGFGEYQKFEKVRIYHKEIKEEE